MQKRIYSLDLLKIIATVMIVFHHFQQIEGFSLQKVLFQRDVFYIGYVLELFFLLSGFFMYRYVQIINNGLSFKAFFLHRWLRFLPMLIFSAIIYQCLRTYYQFLCTGNVEGSLFSLWKTVTAALGISHGWVFQDSDVGVNNHIWYISVLLCCYLWFYFTTWLSKKTKTSPWYIFAFLALVGVWINAKSIHLPFLTPHTGRGFRTFFLGIILGKLINEWRPLFSKNLSRLINLIIIVILIGIPCLLFFSPFFVSDNIGNIMAFLYFPALIYFFTEEAIKKILNWKWFGILASISFHAYIWHVCGIILLNILSFLGYIKSEQKSIIAMVFFTIFLFFFSAASYFGIEKPISRKIANSIGKGNI